MYSITDADLRGVKSFEDLIDLLRDKLDWELAIHTLDDLTFDYSPDEIGLDPVHKVKVTAIKQLRIFGTNAPWQVFLLSFDKEKRLPVTVLRRILRAFSKKQIERADSPNTPKYNPEDILAFCFHKTDLDENAVTVVHFDLPQDQKRAFKLTSFGWSDSSHNRTVIEFNLPNLKWQHNLSDEEWRKVWLSAFDKQKLTEQFYIDYKKVFDGLIADLRLYSNDKSWSHDYALQFLNRCMFMCFVSRKRWINNDPNFFISFYETYKRTNSPKDTFFEKWLKVLFFHAFNRTLTNDNKQFPPNLLTALFKAPYLNGGLFKENDLDERHKFSITDARYEQIHGFLNRYNFTVSEDTPLDQEVAVDAEMLGRVYENLVNKSDQSDERSDSGIFYTPRTEIDLMCRLSLVDYLSNHLVDHDKEIKSLLYEFVFAFSPSDKFDADRKIKDKDLWPRIGKLIEEITVVDPACGSGSFLIGMLQVLDDIAERVNRNLGEYETVFDRRKRIIGNSLYGVDVKRWAVEVAELRLWLHLVIESEIKGLDLKEKPLLPNLTFKVRCGDSIVQEIGGVRISADSGDYSISTQLRGKLRALKADKSNFYYNTDKRTIKTKEALQHEERNLFREILTEKLTTLNNRAVGLRSSLASKRDDLYGNADYVYKGDTRPKLESELSDIENRVKEVSNALLLLDKPSFMPFIWDIAFVEIFHCDKNGFDIVIGNPPYVRQERICDPTKPYTDDTELKKEYKKKLSDAVTGKFAWYFETLPKGAKLDAKSDLYIYFYFAGLSLLNDKGSFVFITSNSWLDVGFGADLQQFLVKQCHIKLVIDNSAKRSFKSADVNTVIVLLSSPALKIGTMLERTARFVMFKVPFEDALSPVLFQEIEEVEDRRMTKEYRVMAKMQSELFESGCEQHEDEDDDDEKPAKRKKTAALGPAIKIVKYIGDKWGGKYLRAPDIYWTILEKGKGKLVRLGDIADVRFGIKTGANDFFYLDAAKIAQWGIEEEFLRPVLKSPRECKRIAIDPRDLKYKIFMCCKDKSELAGTAALDYIEWGEKQDFHTRPSCKGRRRWWEIGERYAPAAVHPASFNEYCRVFYNCDVLVDKRLYEINTDENIRNLILSLNSVTYSIFIELGSRAGLGEGLVDLTVYEAKYCLILHPKYITSDYVPFMSFIHRTPLQHKKEILDPIVQACNDLVFDAIDLTSGEREAVYEAVINLVEARLKKAGSV